MIDYSYFDKAINIPGLFNSISINSSSCSNSGAFQISGVFIFELKNGLNFKLSFSKSENVLVSCSIKKGIKD